MLLTRGASRYPGVNFAMRTGPGADPARLVQRATTFFRPRADGFAIRARAHADADLAAYCRRHDLFMAGENLGLVRREAIEPRPPPSGARIHLVDSPSEGKDFGTVAAAAFATIGLPEATAAQIFAYPEAMLAPHLVAMLAYVDNRPAATALSLLSHGIAGLYWVGTAPWARRRGLARFVTIQVHNHVLALGARGVVLQASSIHADFYRALGFETLTRYPWFFAGHLPT